MEMQKIIYDAYTTSLEFHQIIKLGFVPEMMTNETEILSTVLFSTQAVVLPSLAWNLIR